MLGFNTDYSLPGEAGLYGLECPRTYYLVDASKSTIEPVWRSGIPVDFLFFSPMSISI